MRILISTVSAALLLAACTMHSDNLSVGDATRVYVAPALCEAAQRCGGLGFTIAYPGGLPDCEQKTLDHVSDKDRLSACTNDEYKACAADYRAAACSSDPNAVLPPIPASCAKC